MAMGDSEHLRHVEGGGPIGWTHPAVHGGRTAGGGREEGVMGAEGGGASGGSAGAARPEVHVVHPSSLARSPVGTGIAVHPDAGTPHDINSI
eukprot:3589802-Alexandrium_andersonii.AAC.1